jgi:hypothetical protein
MQIVMLLTVGDCLEALSLNSNGTRWYRLWCAGNCHRCYLSYLCTYDGVKVEVNGKHDAQRQKDTAEEIQINHVIHVDH